MPIVIRATSYALASGTKIAAALPLAKQFDGRAAVMARGTDAPVDIGLMLEMPILSVGTGKVLQCAAAQFHCTLKHRRDR